LVETKLPLVSVIAGRNTASAFEGRAHGRHCLPYISGRYKGTGKLTMVPNVRPNSFRSGDVDGAYGQHEHHVPTANPGARARSARAGNRRGSDRASDTAQVATADAATAAEERIEQATLRDETARLGDLTASSRDLAADARDSEAARQADCLLASEMSGDPAVHFLDARRGSGRSEAAAIRSEAAAIRSEAAADRAGAAIDRKRAATDRRLAAADRRQAHVDRESAQFDSLTGVFLRDVGRVNLQDAIDRARRSAEPFVLAFIDVDGLKELNDSEGHAAGDALLRTVGNVLRSKLRRNDPIARVGGDEFLCGLTNTRLNTSQVRFDEIRAAVELGPATGSITVGLATLGDSDTLEDLTARADLDMYVKKAARQRGRDRSSATRSRRRR
jgi:diguanylate cyclase (GGDEF)-like protein